MNKYSLIAATGLVSLMLAAPAFADTMPAAPAAPAAPQDQQKMQGDRKAEEAAHFGERKQEILKKIGEHIAEMQKRQSCVQSANDGEALHACFPGMMGGGPGGGQGGGMGGGEGGEHHGGEMMHHDGGMQGQMPSGQPK